jgi:hypothetical protein
MFSTAPENKKRVEKVKAQYICCVDQSVTLIIGFSKLRGNFTSRTVKLGFPCMTLSCFESSFKAQPV